MTRSDFFKPSLKPSQAPIQKPTKNKHYSRQPKILKNKQNKPLKNMRRKEAATQKIS